MIVQAQIPKDHLKTSDLVSKYYVFEVNNGDIQINEVLLDVILEIIDYFFDLESIKILKGACILTFSLL